MTQLEILETAACAAAARALGARVAKLPVTPKREAFCELLRQAADTLEPPPATPKWAAPTATPEPTPETTPEATPEPVSEPEAEEPGLFPPLAPPPPAPEIL